MRVLLISDGYRSLGDRVRIDFVKKLSKLCDFKIFGRKEDIINPNLAPVPFNPRISCDELVKLFNPDVILFMLYNPTVHFNTSGDICKRGIPTAIIEVDHYYKDEVFNGINLFDWYKSMGFTLLIRKHFYKEEPPIPSVWLPSSANEEEFDICYDENRENKIGFAGSSADLKYYDIRRNAIEILKNNNLLASTWGKVYGRDYIDYLHRYVGCLSCSGGKLHTCLAKTFEIPLSGAALLTNWMHGKKELFGNKQCFFEYKDDCSNLVDVANTVVNDVDMRKEIVTNALEVVRAKHTDKRRIVELYWILESLVDGKEPPRIWGQ